MSVTIPDPDTIDRIEFLKRDEFTTDLICCEISSGTVCYFFHEEWDGWSKLISKLEGLSGFDKDWFSHVSLPPFHESRFVAYVKATK